MMTDAKSSVPLEAKKRSFYEEDEEEIVVKPSTELVADEYEHNAENMPLLYVFYVDKDIDVAQSLVEEMNTLGYNGIIFNIHEKKDLWSNLEKIRNNPGNRNGVVIIFLALFERSNAFLVINDTDDLEDVELKSIWNYFSAKNCPDLHNKPKVFIFCSSKIRKGGTLTDAKLHVTPEVYSFPAESDILIIYQMINEVASAVKHDFLNQFCDNIQKFSRQHDIIDLVTQVQLDKKPLIISTLTRKFYLSASKQRGHYLSILENNQRLNEGLENIHKDLEKITIKKKKEKNKFIASITASFRRKPEEKPQVTKAPTEADVVESKPSRKTSTSSGGGFSKPRQRTDSESSKRTSGQDKPRWKY